MAAELICDIISHLIGNATIYFIISLMLGRILSFVLKICRELYNDVEDFNMTTVGGEH